MSAVKVSAMTATESRHYRPENNGQIVQLANWPFSSRKSFGTFFRLRCQWTLKDTHLSRPMLCICNVTATSNVFLCVDCVGKNLGIASAGAAGLKELMRVLQATMRAYPFWDFAIPFGRNGSTVLTF